MNCECHGVPMYVYPSTGRAVCHVDKKAYAKQYRARNRDRLNAYFRQWRLDASPEMKERQRELQRKWCAENWMARETIELRKQQKRRERRILELHAQN